MGMEVINIIYGNSINCTCLQKVEKAFQNFCLSIDNLSTVLCVTHPFQQAINKYTQREWSTKKKLHVLATEITFSALNAILT